MRPVGVNTGTNLNVHQAGLGIRPVASRRGILRSREKERGCIVKGKQPGAQQFMF